MPKYTARQVKKVVTITADDIARNEAAHAKFMAERQALHMSPEGPFALLDQSSPGKEISPGIYQKEVTVPCQQAAWRGMLLLLLPSESVASTRHREAQHAQLCMRPTLKSFWAAARYLYIAFNSVQV